MVIEEDITLNRCSYIKELSSARRKPNETSQSLLKHKRKRLIKGIVFRKENTLDLKAHIESRMENINTYKNPMFAGLRPVPIKGASKLASV